MIKALVYLFIVLPFQLCRLAFWVCMIPVWAVVGFLKGYEHAAKKR